MRLLFLLLLLAAPPASAQSAPPPGLRVGVGLAATAGAVAGAAAGAQLGEWVCEARGCKGFVPVDLVVGVLVGGTLGSVATVTFVHTRTGQRGSVVMATLGVMAGALGGATVGGEWGALAGAVLGGGIGYGLPVGRPVGRHTSAVQVGAAPSGVRVQVRL